ncbi:putative leucine-rich repeat-containing protein DDB_G0290503 [Nymphalis io]|uniref:putative leucine-rich repeat-containing protein DDB_G0290503 n=1 Tax=Inachis io TaxID=171585 RepID=UPI0021690956|nr:putative leucine-rich repeat-containing protein DDB_G0290503 [Nymphalis io]
MKTLIVLCSLVTITVAVPTLSRGNFNNYETVIEDFPEKIIREKKSPLHDSPQDLTVNDGKEISQERINQKTETSTLEKSKVGFSKPIIIKKKLGYHVYRDSDEEMAHADPNENCRKQFKVKLCDNEPLLNSHSNNVITSEHPHENISDKEMEKSIKMAKDAVEKLQRDLFKMEQNKGKFSNSKENLESDMVLQQDIETAKSALEHIQNSIGNFESIDFQASDPKAEESQLPKSSDAKAITEWKETIGNIYKSVEIPRNIEDAFKNEKQNVIKSDNINVPEMRENQILDDQRKDQISIQSMKAVNEENNTKLNLKSKDDQNTNAEHDMFVSTTDHKESIMKLHSDSLTRDSDVFTNDSNFENEKKIHMLMPKPEEEDENDKDMSARQHNDEIFFKTAVQVEKNLFNTLTKNSDINEIINEKTETRPLVSKNLSSEQKTDSIKSEGEFANAKQTLSEALDVSGTEQKNIEHLKHRFSDDDNRHSSDVKMTLLKPVQMKDSPNVLDNNSSPQKNIDIPDNKFLDKADVTDTFNARVSHEQLENIQQSLPSIPAHKSAENCNADHISNEFSKTQTTDSHNIDNLLNENHETQDFPSKHLTQQTEQKDQLLQASKSHLQNTQLPTMNIEDHLNERNNFNELPFMNFAEEKYLNENVPQHIKSFSESNNVHSITPSTKTNEFRNQQMANEYMKYLNENVPQHIKSFSESNNVHSITPSTKTNEFRNQQMANEYLNENVPQHIKSFSESNNVHSITPSTKTNEFRNQQMANEYMKYLNENVPQHIKSFSESNNVHSITPSTKTNEFRNQQMANEYMKARMHQIHNMEQQLRENHRFDDFISMPSASRKQHIDNLSEQFKSEAEFHNDQLLPAFSKTNGLRNGQTDLNRHTSMHLIEDHNLGHELSDTQHLNDPFLLRWAQEKQQNDNLAQTFDGATELNRESHMSDHLLEHMPTNRFSNNFEDNTHDVFPMRPRMHEHLHMMKHPKTYDMDSSMQQSMHIGMRDSNIPLDHHHHHHNHGLARSSYSPSLPIGNSSPGAVGVFSEANTGCGIPLLLSCSPSVVSGSLAKAQPTGISSPAYRSGDELMYYMKRDANDIEGLKNVKVHKPSKSFNR